MERSRNCAARGEAVGEKMAHLYKQKYQADREKQPVRNVINMTNLMANRKYPLIVCRQ